MLLRTRQIIRCRLTATLRRHQTKQNTTLNWGRVRNQLEHRILLTKFESVQTTVFSEKYSSSGMLKFELVQPTVFSENYSPSGILILIKVLTICVLRLLLLQVTFLSCCVIKVLVAFLCCSLVFEFSVCIGVFVIGLSEISFFFSFHVPFCLQIRTYCI